MNVTDNIPSPSVPFLGPDGRIAQVWWQFMVSMFSRTGAAAGVDSAALLALVDAQQTTITTLQATAVTLQKEIDDLNSRVKIPDGYSNVTIAHTTRKIPYYS